MKVGVILPLGEDAALGAPKSWSYLREMALLAEANGFDSVWTYDHLLYRFPEQPTTGIWEGWTIFSALCEATQRVELGQLVMCASWRNPGMMAKMAITADEVSGGRVILGLGAGWHEPEFTAFGHRYHHLVDQFEDALRIITPLLHDGVVDYQGEYFSAPDCAMVPRGPRPGRPPVLVASRGPRMLRLTAQYADAWNAAWFGTPDLYHACYAAMSDACAEVGRDIQTLEITAGLQIGYPELGEIPAGVDRPDKLLKGSAEEIAHGLKAFADLGVAHVICNCMPATHEAVVELAKALRIFREL